MANTLTLLRLLLVIPFGLWMLRQDQSAVIAASIAVLIAIATDLLDGPVARRTGRATAKGQFFDHVTDFLFVTVGLTAGALRGVFPLLLPILVTLAFVQYALDSYWLRRRLELRMSALGRWNGIFYFVPLCGDLLDRSGLIHAVGLGFLVVLIPWICWALIATTLASIADRYLALIRATPDSPGAETRDRSPR